MRKNVGTIDALCRLLLGFVGFGWAVSRLARSRFFQLNAFLLLILSAQKIAEGITRYCPVLAAFDINTRDSNQKTPYRIEHYARRNVRKKQHPG